MADQIVLAWTVNVANTPLGPVQAAARLAAVPLYTDPTTDPVLGQNFGLTVASDATTNDATSATRTLTLNMTAANTPKAPPPFPCHPITSTPPVLPYPLRRAVTLPGSFFPQQGLMNVPTTMSQIPSLSIGDSVQFLSQEGVFYSVASVGPTSFNLSAAYTGTTKNTGAFKEVADPASLARIAVYSTSDLDTNGVAINPAIPAGSGAHTVTLIYNDSTGAGPFTTQASLTGRRPAAFSSPDAQGIDVAEIVQLIIPDVGAFGNSVGQITLVELSEDLPAIPSNATATDYTRLTDEAQMLIENTLAYLPPSYFSLAQQSLTMPQLLGDFMLTTGSTSVPTTEDQTGSLSQGSVIQFAEQMTLDTAFGTLPVYYTVAHVTPKYITLTSPFTGIDNTNTGTNQEGTNSNASVKGNLGAEILKKPSGAFCVALAQPPSSAQLSAPIGQFLEPETAHPPLNPPLDPQTVPAPTFLSGLYTRTLSLAMAGVPITSAPITFI
jgi:hypothetical protein